MLTNPRYFDMLQPRLAGLLRETIRSSLSVPIGVAFAPGLSGAPGQDETDQRFGNVHFATSCNEAAQRRFDRGMRYQHSFWDRQSKEIFEEVVKADPECGPRARCASRGSHNVPPARRRVLVGRTGTNRSPPAGRRPWRTAICAHNRINWSREVRHQ